MAVDWFGSAVMGAVRSAALRGVVRGTESVHAEATKLILDTEKTGRVYRRRGVEHKASAPGEPPASDTGRLVQSGRTEIDAANLAGDAIWSTNYAELLEYGTQRMEPRPYARPALANKSDEITQDIRDEIIGALK